MNLDKVIKDLEGMKKAGFASCSIQGFLNQLEKVTESVVVDKFVADWYEEHKDDLEFNIWDWVSYSKGETGEGDVFRFYEWLNCCENRPIETLVCMHKYGYEVEEEKLYTVRIVGLTSRLGYLNYDSIDDEWYFKDADNGYAVRTHHTRKQLEDAGFGEVFNSPLFEVKEVK